MRLHALEITAFGPYAGTESVDMDALTASGLFLLEGPTGAGKSTILDAVTFALYGTTASRGSSDDRLHSDFADPRQTPSVSLELSVAGERLRVRRTPAHERPKLRGEGTTLEAASVHLERLEDGAWCSVTSNKAEAGTYLAERIGLSAEQFTQVVLLPQGEFATFLKADDDTRRALLTTLFGTRLYDHVTRELEALRTDASRRREEARARIGQAVAAAAEAAGLEGADAERLRGLPDEERPEALEMLALDLRRLRMDSERALAAAEETLTAATATAREAESVRDLHSELAAARAALALHEATRGDHEREEIELRLAVAAAPVSPLLEQLDDVDAEVRSGREELALIAPDLDHESADGSGAEGLLSLARADDAAAAALDHLVLLERGLEDRRGALEVLHARHAEATTSLDTLRRHAIELPERIRAAERSLEEASAAAAALPAGESERRVLESRLAAAEELADLLPRLELAGSALDAADEERRSLVDTHQSVLQRHLDGIAARLAAQLDDGAPCPVCGSLDHPRPAEGRDDDATAADVETALARRTEAEDRVALLASDRDGLAVRCAGLAGRAGDDDVEAVRDRLDALRVAAEASRSAAESLPALRAALTGLRAEADRLAEDTTRAAETVASAHERAVAAGERLAQDEALIAAGRAGHPTVADRQRELATSAARHRAVAAALAALADALARRASLLERATTAAAGGGFADVEEARAARRAPAQRAALADAVAAWTARSVALATAGADPRFAGLDPSDADDAEVRATTAGAARDDAERARVAAHTVAVEARRRDESFQRRRGDVTRAEEDLAGVLADTAAVVRLAGLAKGTGPSRMSLTTYVLRRWFDQVVQAANLRLSTMSAGRYELERVDDVDKGERRAGLSLRVVDRHTGESRSPKSLSGGETFYTSLALALGLADVVRAEAGGVELDTLFIDEGFGTLDSETLDQVMSVVDELRNGGRVVGIVSHVADLKEQVAERLEVRRRPDGSSFTRVVA